jgi:hypothetical protein
MTVLAVDAVVTRISTLFPVEDRAGARDNCATISQAAPKQISRDSVAVQARPSPLTPHTSTIAIGIGKDE